jgi:peptidoglycan/xylan/chitin deacetylase (PgdA/CDA1 family)
MTESVASQAKELVWESLAWVDQRLGASGWVGNETDAVLCYHAVGDPVEWGNISRERLRRDIEFVSDHYEVVDLPAVLEPAEDKQVAITFDDGHENFYTEALPVLRDLSIPATVFIVSEAIGENDTNLNSEATMTDKQIGELVEGDLVTVGNHTRTHPFLSEIDDPAELEAEIVGAREDLEERFGITVNRFCYPSGDFNETAVDVVRDSHEYAVTTVPSLVIPDNDPHCLPRIQAHWTHRRMQWELTDASAAIRNAARSAGVVTR